MFDPARVITLGPKPEASKGRPVLIEVAHGATSIDHYTRVREALSGTYPQSLIDFFLVNTDQGAPELALAIGKRIHRENRDRSVTVAICEIPRTFIDVNRKLDVSATELKEGKVTAGIPPYVTDPGDKEILLDLYHTYHAKIGPLFDAVCGNDGMALMLHTYAPRSVDAEVDEKIGETMREAYTDPERWPLRLPIDLISRDPEGIRHTDPAIFAALAAAFDSLDLEVGDSATYPLASVTMGYHYAVRHLNRAVCLEVRRDLLAAQYEPFQVMRMDRDALARVGGAIIRALF